MVPLVEVVRGRIKLRRIDGGRKIATVLRQHGGVDMVIRRAGVAAVLAVGFIVAPLTGSETRYYTFWLTADGRVADVISYSD
jgi:hypothetical protein